MTTKVRVVGAIASKHGVTLYLDSGQEHNLKLDSMRSKAILDDMIPRLAKHKVVEMNLEDFSVEARLEQKSKGFLRFVREKVAKIGDFFQLGHSGGVTDQPGIKPGEVAVVVPGKTPIEVETLVAYVGDVRVPGVEKLAKQMERAAYGESFAGFELFMKRIASVIDKRGHSVQELLNFMERGDLPIADDGSIIGYKVLQTHGKGPDKFVDCHSKQVWQQLGSYVHMKESSVDPSKRTECSTGLHIARRGYLRGFSGDIITIVKVAPEDVIAVPNNEPDKMRAAAYHIVQVLPKEVHEILRTNKPMTSNELASRLLADAIAGRHIGIIEDVFITEAKGGGVIVTPKNGAAAPALGSVVAKALDDAEQISVRDIRKAADAAIDAPDVEDAAATGNMGAALSVQPADMLAASVLRGIAAEADTRAAERGKAAPAKKARAKKASTPTASVEPAAPTKPEKDLPQAHQDALKLLDQGLSGREVAQKVTICRKTLSKLKKAYRPE